VWEEKRSLGTSPFVRFVQEVKVNPDPKVTVAIPTYNRSGLLKASLESVLTQDCANFRVLVLDNASTDDTEAVVRSFADARIAYVKNETNLGLFRNWNRAIEINESPYLTILQDDDAMLPGFIRESVRALDEHAGAAFSVTQAKRVDINGAPVERHPRYVSDQYPEGLVNGLEYLHRIVAGNKLIVYFSSIMMRSAALAAIGPFDIPHSKDTIDYNLYLRFAAQFDIVFIPKELCQVRSHAGQESRLHLNPNHSDMGTGPVAVAAERVDAIGYLMRSRRAAESSYRRWLADRLLDLSTRRSQLTQLLVPTLNVSWTERVEIARQEIAALIPAEARFILVDEASLGSEVVADGHTIPFLERDGQDWGPPADDETAIRELERLRRAGAAFIVFPWPAFWWLDYYSGLRDYLGSKFRCTLKNSRLVAFDLKHKK
jgi:glycosyltransferase involved in cell wall biosynthesis